MELFIHKYLTRHYELITTEEASKKLRIYVDYGIYKRDNNSVYKYEINNCQLLRELETIFGIGELECKKYIDNWAKSIDKKVNLSTYWSKLEQVIPIAIKIAAQTIGIDLVSVQPMDAPMALGMSLMYLKYEPTPDRNG